MESLVDILNSDEVLRRHGRYYSTRLSIISDEDEYHFDISDGEVSPGASVDPDFGFSLCGSKAVWIKFCQEIPPPEHHELGALIASEHLEVKGDMYALQSNFMYVRRLLVLWRNDQRSSE